MKLYQNKLSPNAKRVRVCANELGINLNIVELDFAKGEHKKPEYVAKNPMGKVPTLEDDDGYVIWESPAILTYLATKNPQLNLFPTDAKSRAEALRWMFWNSAHFESAIYALVFEKIVKPMMGAESDQKRIDSCTKDFERYAPVLNQNLEGKTWILGDAYSVADIAVGVVAELTLPLGLDLSRFPHIKSWVGRLTERAAWKKASA
jgi:glutathione S-transferase